MNEQTSAIYGEQIAGRAAQVRTQLLNLSANAKASTFDLSDLLHEVQENSYAQAWGFSSLLDYAAKELGLKKRKAQYLTRIVKVCQKVGLTRAQYEPAGTSKLREITTLNPEGSYFNVSEHKNESLEEHIVRLILDYDKMTLDQVRMEVARLKGQTGKDRRIIRSYGTDITTWTEVIDTALEKARRYLGSKGRDDEGNAKEYSEGECYECICAAFNSDPNYDPDPSEREDVTEESQAPPTMPMEAI